MEKIIMRSQSWIILPAVALASLVFLTGGAAEETKAADDSKEWDRIVDKAIAYLRTTQAEDGSWSGKASPGITGVVLTGPLQTGKVTSKDPTIEKGLKYVEALINPKAGHIAGKDPRIGLQNYVTCVNVLALVAAERDSYKAVVGDAVKFLKKLQWDEEEGKNKDSDFYGGGGDGSKARPDLAHTHVLIEAPGGAGLPKDD